MGYCESHKIVDSSMVGTPRMRTAADEVVEISGWRNSVENPPGQQIELFALVDT